MQAMKNELHIAAIVDKPQLLNEMVSKLVFKKSAGRKQTNVLPDWKEANVACTEAYVNGSLLLDRKREHFEVPFITGFFFTCLQHKKGEHKIEWSHSLS